MRERKRRMLHSPVRLSAGSSSGASPVRSPLVVLIWWVLGIALAAQPAQTVRAQLNPFTPSPGSAELSPDVQINDVDNAARVMLAQVDQFLAAEQWDDAVESLRRLMGSRGEGLLEVAGREDSTGFRRYVTLREACHRRLADLHWTAPEALALYRQRVDPLAERWFRQALQEQRPHRLARVIEQFFASSFGDDALFHWGEYALQQGDFTGARGAWEQISGQLRAPDSGGPLWLEFRGDASQAIDTSLLKKPERTPWLAYPDTDLDLAQVRARLVVVSILEGADQRAAMELDLFRRLHPQAQGRLAGRSGLYVELLERLLAQSRDWESAEESSQWRTFGGSASRNALPGPPVDIARRPIWKQALPKLLATAEMMGENRPRVAESASGLLSYHPLILNDMALVAQGETIESIQAYDLQTGRPLWPAPPKEPPPPDEGLAPRIVLGSGRPRPHVGVARRTLTALDSILLARIGSPVTGFATTDHSLRTKGSGAIAGLDLRAQRKLLFKIELTAPEWGPDWAFEGAPLSDGEGLYVALRRRDDVRAESHVACFDLKTQKLRWRRLLSAAETPGHGQWEERTHNLLTLSAGVLYCNTNLGAVAAVRAEDGRVLWLSTYPRAPFRQDLPTAGDRHVFRDLNPCLLHRGRAIVAPADSAELFALDTFTGEKLWSTDPERVRDVVHLLGVGEGNLIAGGDRLYWIDVLSGAVRGTFPQPGGDAVRGYGRGQLVGDQVYWPTRDAIYVLDQRGPWQLRQPIDLSPMGVQGGNLVMTQGVLLIASADHLYAFNAWGHSRLPDAVSAATP